MKCKFVTFSELANLIYDCNYTAPVLSFTFDDENAELAGKDVEPDPEGWYGFQRVRLFDNDYIAIGYYGNFALHMIDLDGDETKEDIIREIIDDLYDFASMECRPKTEDPYTDLVFVHVDDPDTDPGMRIQLAFDIHDFIAKHQDVHKMPMSDASISSIMKSLLMDTAENLNAYFTEIINVDSKNIEAHNLKERMLEYVSNYSVPAMLRKEQKNG